MFIVVNSSQGNIFKTACLYIYYVHSIDIMEGFLTFY